MMLRIGNDGVCSAVNEEELVYADKKELEEFIESYSQLKSENEHIKNTIKEAYNNERTELGRSVLKQLLEQIQ